MQLSEDDKDIIRDLVHTGQIKTLLKVLEQHVHQREADLLAFNYKPGQEQLLCEKKVAASAVRAFHNSIRNYFLTYKKGKVL